MEIKRLLDQADWVRKLAYTLVNDPDEADDVVQDTWTAALESPPRDPARSRSWLARVLRNFAYSRFRRRERRTARERLAASTEAVPSSEEGVERLEMTRLLVDVVYALEEPARTVVVLRYFEGLTSSAIARRLDISAGAVRMRLKRALEALRAALEERSGASGADWRLLLLPLLGSVVDARAEASTTSDADASGCGTSAEASAMTAPAMTAPASGTTANGLLSLSLALSCLGAGWSLRGWNEGVSLGSETPPVGQPPVAARVEPRELESCIDALRAQLTVSERRAAERSAEIFELRRALAKARVEPGPERVS